MKIASEIALSSPREKIWNTLADFAAYPEWNRVVKAVRGQVETDGIVELDLQFYGKNPERKSAKVTGMMPPKYLSWAWTHPFGSWFLAAEHVFRIREKEDGRIIFHQEIYYTGLSIRFGRGSTEHTLKRTLDKLNDDIKDRLGEPSEG